ncbi:hypothetical protein [Leifsonia sp. 2MCAF36]|uniref:hypothetical protein n=1 Tax=Leifsonia sp. 2MCAF36 TaxID=3232988 RepID=UPI003F9E00E4
MNDDEGLEEFGELACWRDVLLRFPGGLTRLYLLPEIAGQLPRNFDRPLNDARTAYERFVRADGAGELPAYEWTEIVER